MSARLLLVKKSKVKVGNGEVGSDFSLLESTDEHRMETKTKALGGLAHLLRLLIFIATPVARLERKPTNTH